MVGDAFEEAFASGGEGAGEGVGGPGLDVGVLGDRAVAVDVDEGFDVAVAGDAGGDSFDTVEDLFVGEAGAIGEKAFDGGDGEFGDEVEAVDEAVGGKGVAGAEGAVADAGGAEGVDGDGGAAEFSESAGGEDGEGAAHGVAGEEEGFAFCVVEEGVDFGPGVSEGGAEAVVDAALVFGAFDEADDGVGEPTGEGDGVGATEGEDGVGVAEAEEAAGASDLVAEGDGAEAEALCGGVGG